MKKNLLSLVVVIIITFFLQLLFGPFFSARLATWPVIQRLGIVRPQAPIVVTNREIIRSDNSEEGIDAVNRAKSRLGSVAVLQNNSLVITGGAIVLTGDGLFVSVATAFPVTGGQYYVVLNDGRFGAISVLMEDSATNLVVVKTDLNSITAAPFATSRDIITGQRLGFIKSGNVNFSARYRQTYAISTQYDNVAPTSADLSSRVFGVQEVGPLTPGEAVVTMSGDVAGLWSGSAVIPADVIKTATGIYLNNNQKFVRPLWGFTHRAVVGSESNFASLPQGAMVVKPDSTSFAVLPGSPAAIGGLQEGDVIIELNGVRINETTLLEEQLERVKPGETATFVVVRNRQSVTLRIVPTELK